MHFKILDRRQEIRYPEHPYCVYLNAGLKNSENNEVVVFLKALEAFLRETFLMEDYVAYVPLHSKMKDDDYIQVHVHFKKNTDAVLFKLIKG